MKSHLGFSAVSILLSSAFLITTYIYERTASDRLKVVSHIREECLQKRDQYSQAELTFKTKARSWASLTREGLMRKTSPHDLQNKIKMLGRLYKFQQVEFQFEELEHAYISTGLELHHIDLRIRSPYDSNIFQFLRRLRSQCPGLFSIEKLSLERVEKGSIPFVEGEIKLAWLHREEDG